jgi:hypothetical protein
MKVKIEVVKLNVEDELKYGASMRQLTYIKVLMNQRGMGDLFTQHFTHKGKVIRNHLTMPSGTKLIKALLSNKEIVFVSPMV